MNISTMHYAHTEYCRDVCPFNESRHVPEAAEFYTLGAIYFNVYPIKRPCRICPISGYLKHLEDTDKYWEGRE